MVLRLTIYQKVEILDGERDRNRIWNEWSFTPSTLRLLRSHRRLNTRRRNTCTDGELGLQCRA